VLELQIQLLGFFQIPKFLKLNKPSEVVYEVFERRGN